MRTTNFDETWYTIHTLSMSVYGFEVPWAHITHKQKNLAAEGG